MADFLKGGDFSKYMVLKTDDVDKYLSESELRKLYEFFDAIADRRQIDGKARGNTYLVVNTDEPYALEIVEILKCNGHWGKAGEVNGPNTSLQPV